MLDDNVPTTTIDTQPSMRPNDFAVAIAAGGAADFVPMLPVFTAAQSGVDLKPNAA